MFLTRVWIIGYESGIEWVNWSWNGGEKVLSLPQLMLKIISCPINLATVDVEILQFLSLNNEEADSSVPLFLKDEIK